MAEERSFRCESVTPQLHRTHILELKVDGQLDPPSIEGKVTGKPNFGKNNVRTYTIGKRRARLKVKKGAAVQNGKVVFEVDDSGYSIQFTVWDEVLALVSVVPPKKRQNEKVFSDHLICGEALKKLKAVAASKE